MLMVANSYGDYQGMISPYKKSAKPRGVVV
nr:MAG TPA: hypothetical protein [Caudoviricetes sp.]